MTYAQEILTLECAVEASTDWGNGRTEGLLAASNVAKKADAEIADLKKQLAESKAVNHGFDRIGECGCSWGSSLHGDICPEHGNVGRKIGLKEEIRQLKQQIAELKADNAWAILELLQRVIRRPDIGRGLVCMECLGVGNTLIIKDVKHRPDCILGILAADHPGSQLLEELSEVKGKLNYYEEALCIGGKQIRTILRNEKPIEVKEIKTEKVTDVLNERDSLRERLEAAEEMEDSLQDAMKLIQHLSGNPKHQQKTFNSLRQAKEPKNGD